MVTRRYIKDYKFSESVTARGGIRTEAVYVGKYYRFEDADGAAKSASSSQSPLLTNAPATAAPASTIR